MGYSPWSCTEPDTTERLNDSLESRPERAEPPGQGGAATAATTAGSQAGGHRCNGVISQGADRKPDRKKQRRGAFLTKRTRCPYTKTADRHGWGSVRLRWLSAWLQARR